MARLTPDNEQRARDLMALYPSSRSALLPVLHLMQEQEGYLPEDGMEHIVERFGLEPAEVLGTSTFYDMFHFEPIGTYLLAICTNIACMLQGAYQLLAHAEERLEVRAGRTSSDGMFTLEEAECLALCANAPCLTANWRFFGDVDEERFDTLIEDLLAGRLASEVPRHGTLSRVPRLNGLRAGPLDGSEPPGGPIANPDGRGPASPHVDLDTYRTTPAVRSLDGGQREPPT